MAIGDLGGNEGVFVMIRMMRPDLGMGNYVDKEGDYGQANNAGMKNLVLLFKNT